MTNEVFFSWRKCREEKFWQTVRTEELRRREKVLDAINRYSTAGLAAYISGFMTSYWLVLRYLPNQLGLISAMCVAHWISSNLDYQKMKAL